MGWLRSFVLAAGISAATFFTVSCGDGDGPSGPEPVDAVQVSPPTASVEVGQTAQFTATVRDKNGNTLTDRAVTWASSSNSVATVSSSGLATGVAEGTATITATSEGKVGSATVTVTPQPVASVEVSPTTLDLTVGQTGQLTATPKNASGEALTGRTVSWDSSDDGVATVDSNGLVTAVAAGSATVTATSEGQTGSADITVSLAVFNPQESVSLSGDHSYQSVNIPAGVTVTASGDLNLTVSEDVTITGNLRGDCVSVDIAGGGAVLLEGIVENQCTVAPDGAGPPLTIIGNGTFDIDGATMESSGEITLKNDPSIVNPPGGAPEASASEMAQNLNGPFPCTLMNYTVVTGAVPAANGIGGDPNGTNGADGSGFIFACNGDLAMKGNVQIETQEGGRGGNGMDAEAAGAHATGGDGGNGGSLYIWAFGDFSATMEVQGTEIKNHLFSGRGGDGGDANGVGSANDALDPAPSGQGDGGWGGAAGVIDIQSAGDFSVDPDVLYVAPGASNPSGGVPGGGEGGTGRGEGARGKDADERNPAKAAQVGGKGIGNGGYGGDAPGFHTIILGSETGFEDIVVDAGNGGAGGEADAVGGRGGDGNEDFPDGAMGGDIEAIGGIGGDAGSSRGGAGGKAFFRGGRGGDGWSDCIAPNFKEGGDGGKGGTSLGGGGKGGAGLNPGGDGTHDTDDVSNGGNGGAGAPIGTGGPAGENQISDPYQSSPGQPGPAQVELGTGSFQDGMDGAVCNLGGNFNFTITVELDELGHAPFIGMPGELVILVGATPQDATNGVFFMSGPAPFVSVQGTFNPTTGEITASGVGTVAGYPNTEVYFTGTIQDGVITGTYQMGGFGMEPGFGGLPGGIPIYYAFSGTLDPG